LRLPKTFTALLSGWLASSPLRHPPFRLFYFGSIGVALGYTMQATIAAWLMATLTPSALMVALVQTASTAPTLLFGLVAGTLADIVDRRRIILITQIVLLTAAIVLGGMTVAGITGPAALLALTFLTGAGFTFYLPAQQASVNELVSRTELASAVALSAVAFNVARAIGPAFAGAIAAWSGSGTAFLAGALFFSVMIFALRRWKGRERVPPGVPERLLSGIQSGLRYARHSAAMRSLIIRNLNFSVCASAFWALLPVIARDQLGLGAGGFGVAFRRLRYRRGRRCHVDTESAATSIVEQGRDLGGAPVDRGYPAGRGDPRHGARPGRRLLCGRRLGHGLRKPYHGHPKHGAGMGPRPRSRDEYSRRPGQPGNRKRHLGRAGVGGGNEHRFGHVRCLDGRAAPAESGRPCCDGNRSRRHARSATA
jgi:MFS family permease